MYKCTFMYINSVSFNRILPREKTYRKILHKRTYYTKDTYTGVAMDPKQINQTFDLTSYVGAIVELAKKVNYHVGPCPMCGGRDRFTVKHTAGGDVWHCRKCAPDGYHTSIDFFIAYHGIDFKE